MAVQKEAVAREARQLGGVGACSLRKSLHFRPSEIVFGAIWEVITIAVTTGIGIVSRALQLTL